MACDNCVISFVTTTQHYLNLLYRSPYNCIVRAKQWSPNLGIVFTVVTNSATFFHATLVYLPTHFPSGCISDPQHLDRHSVFLLHLSPTAQANGRGTDVMQGGDTPWKIIWAGTTSVHWAQSGSTPHVECRHREVIVSPRHRALYQTAVRRSDPIYRSTPSYRFGQEDMPPVGRGPVVYRPQIHGAGVLYWATAFTAHRGRMNVFMHEPHVTVARSCWWRLHNTSVRDR